MGDLARLAQSLVRGVLREGDCAVDATVGNGHDTVFLAELVGSLGCVLGFEVQETALQVARERLFERGVADRVRLILCSHDQIGRCVDPVMPPRCVMFNLGYCPGLETGVVTHPESTIPALEASIAILAPGGLITVVAYPGHLGGVEECERLRSWATEVSERVRVRWVVDVDLKNLRPGLLCIGDVAAP